MKPWGVLAAVSLLALSAAAQAGEVWKPADAENTLVIDTQKGRIFVELHPEIAPKAVERIKLLARRGTYDGLQFWRVVPGFVVQADPGNVEGGKTELPNLKPEFTFRLTDAIKHKVFAHPQGLSEGLIGAMPYVSVAETATPKRADGSLYAWGSYCPGVMGMGRDAERDSANAEIFFMTGPYPAIDRDYTPVGRIIAGYDALTTLPEGEPPAHPDTITRVQVLADMKDAPKVEVQDTQSPFFATVVERARKAKGADFSICDVPVASRIVP